MIGALRNIFVLRLEAHERVPRVKRSEICYSQGIPARVLNATAVALTVDLLAYFNEMRLKVCTRGREDVLRLIWL